jgi:DNA repair exonuclease SbcCD nuclease subunit
VPKPRPARIVHTSDVHLGAYSTRAESSWNDRRHLIETAFSRVIDLANDESADALLIAGDFFDNDRVAQDVVDFAIEQLRRYAGPKFLIPGNHDPMDEGRIYSRHDLEAAVPGLRIIREHAGEFVEADEVDIVVWGRAYHDSDWHFRPLEGLPQRQDSRWHIAMAHGHYVPDEGEQHRSLLMKESEVAAGAGHWDYMAFGHWEPHADVSTGGVTAVYSGAPMPLTDANTRAGWAAVVDFTEDGVSWRLHPVDPRKQSTAR